MAEIVHRGAAKRQRLFYRSHTTCRQPFETSVQRGVRGVARGFDRIGLDVTPVGYDERRRCIEIIGQGASAFEAQLAVHREPPLLFVPKLTADPTPTRA